MDRVVDDYGPVVAGLENDIDEIEVEVFSGNAGVSRRIYQLSREVIEFQRATKPLVGILEQLIVKEDEHTMGSEMQRYLRDVYDHAVRVTQRVEGFRELLANILEVNVTVVGINQNDEVKRISAWAAILAVPTVVSGIYGMNFDYMPELHWQFGYPYALALIILICVVLHRLFKWSGWL